MRQKRIRDKMIQVWLHEDEYRFLQGYSEEKLMTLSDLVRYWIRYTMISEGVYKEPFKPKAPKKSMLNLSYKG